MGGLKRSWCCVIQERGHPGGDNLCTQNDQQCSAVPSRIAEPPSGRRTGHAICHVSHRVRGPSLPVSAVAAGALCILALRGWDEYFD